MRRVLLLCGVAACSLGAIEASNAADFALKAPAHNAPAAYSWTGFYIGGNAGYAWSGDTTASFSPNDTFAAFIGTSGPTTFDTAGALGGLQLGYNWQLNQALLAGFETDFDLSGLDGSGTATTTRGGGISLTSNAETRVSWFGTVRARLGVLPTNNLLFYGTGGLAYGRVAQSASYSDNPGSPSFSGGVGEDCNVGTTCYSGSSARIATGWTAGGGLEYALLNNWSVKAEYLYVKLDDSAAVNENLANSSITAQYSDLAFQLVRVGADYKF